MLEKGEYVGKDGYVRNIREKKVFRDLDEFDKRKLLMMKREKGYIVSSDTWNKDVKGKI